MAPKQNRRSENRCRYYIRREAERRGWDLRHISSGGDVLEEQEIEAYFHNIGLEGERPDFLFCLVGDPTIIVEAKNEVGKLKQAQKEAEDYADKINAIGKYSIKVAIGAAGEEDKGFEISVSFLTHQRWISLTSHGFALTTFPTKTEVEIALKADNGSTKVSVPSQAEFVDAAIETSRILRTAKIEAPLRPKVIGALVLAMYQGQIDTTPTNALFSVNTLAESAINAAHKLPDQNKVKDSIIGFDTNPTVWALSMLNMFFRGDGKSHIYNESCFDDNIFSVVNRRCTRAFLNPPFSQDEEPEYLFVDRAMDALEPGGFLTVVVYAGIFADMNHNAWRQRFLLKHKLLAMISLPEDLFYPTAAPTSIMVAEAHVPLASTDKIFMARIWNDGYEKLKGKRVERAGNQIDEIVNQFHIFMKGKTVISELVTVGEGCDILP
jgi:hypothetical protein